MSYKCVHNCCICISILSCKIYKIEDYQWTDFHCKQNNPLKWTLIPMFCWFDYFHAYFFLYIFFLFSFSWFSDSGLSTQFCELFLMNVVPVWYYQASGLMTWYFLLHVYVCFFSITFGLILCNPYRSQIKCRHIDNLAW